MDKPGSWKNIAALELFWRRDGVNCVEVELVDHDSNQNIIHKVWLSPGGDKAINRAEISNAFGQMVADHLFEKLGNK